MTARKAEAAGPKLLIKRQEETRAGQTAIIGEGKGRHTAKRIAGKACAAHQGRVAGDHRRLDCHHGCRRGARHRRCRLGRLNTPGKCAHILGDIVVHGRRRMNGVVECVVAGAGIKHQPVTETMSGGISTGCHDVEAILTGVLVHICEETRHRHVIGVHAFPPAHPVNDRVQPGIVLLHPQVQIRPVAPVKSDGCVAPIGLVEHENV